MSEESGRGNLLCGELQTMDREKPHLQCTWDGGPRIQILQEETRDAFTSLFCNEDEAMDEPMNIVESVQKRFLDTTPPVMMTGEVQRRERQARAMLHLICQSSSLCI